MSNRHKSLRAVSAVTKTSTSSLHPFTLIWTHHEKKMKKKAKTRKQKKKTKTGCIYPLGDLAGCLICSSVLFFLSTSIDPLAGLWGVYTGFRSSSSCPPAYIRRCGFEGFGPLNVCLLLSHRSSVLFCFVIGCSS